MIFIAATINKVVDAAGWGLSRHGLVLDVGCSSSPHSHIPTSFNTLYRP